MERIIKEGLKRGKVERLSADFDYYRFRESFRKVERGTAITKGKIVWGFPHIKRIFTLENGIKRNMGAGHLHVEEKIDGFNVRIAWLHGKAYAFSRGGFLDSFVTEKAREMDLRGFFKEDSKRVLCGEMLGNTPHTTPTNDYDVKLLIFDIDAGDGSYLPPKERYGILKDHGIECVPKLGRFKADDYQGLKKVARALHRGRKEGMVIKSDDRRHAVKYVTPFADIDDIEKTSDILFDMPIGFYYQRILRSAFFIEDFGFDQDKYAAMLGKAFYKGLHKALRTVKAGREIDEEFEIRIKDRKVWEDVKRRMSRDIGLEKLWEREEKGRIRIRFRKIYRKTTRKLAAYANGKGITD